MAQVASATMTPTMLNDVVNKIKEHIALVVAEVVARCLSELTLDLVNRILSKATLPVKVATVANNAVKAANKANFGTQMIDALAVKENIVRICFPPPASEAKSAQNATTSQNTKSPLKQ